MFDWFWEFLYSLLKSMLYCVDFILTLAKRLVGIKPVTIEGSGENDLLNYFLTDERVTQAFSIVAIIGIALLFIFTAAAVVRSVGKLGEGKSPLAVCMDGGKAIMYFLLIPVTMIIGNLFINAVMSALYQATAVGGTSLGGSLLGIFADEAFDGSGTKAEVLENFAQGVNGYNYNSTGNVNKYFDLKDINYFLGYASCIFILFMLIRPLFSFVERIISLVLLFIISPIPVSVSVLDDGARFKMWRDEVINKFIVAYGSLIAINVFIILVGAISKVQFFTSADTDAPTLLNGLARLVFIMGGAFACKMSTVMLGNLVNRGAGSQHAQDMQNVSSPFARMAHMAGAFGAGAVLRNPISNSIRRNADAAIHRKGNARRFMKEEAERKKYAAEHPDLFSKHTEKANSDGMAYVGQRSYGPPQSASPSAKVGAGIESVLAGRESAPQTATTQSQAHSDKDDAVNKSSAATVKDAMKSSRTSIDNDQG